MQLARQRAIRTVRTNEARDGDGGTISEQLRDLCDAADVFGAVGGGEA
jgi:hypothetical protein